MATIIWDVQTILLIICALYVIFIQSMLNAANASWLQLIIFKFLPFVVALTITGCAFKIF